jgi:hypothetical protein
MLSIILYILNLQQLFYLPTLGSTNIFFSPYKDTEHLEMQRQAITQDQINQTGKCKLFVIYKCDEWILSFANDSIKESSSRRGHYIKKE